MKKRVYILALVIIFFTMAWPMMAIAQDIPPFEDQVEDVPFDGGVSLLIAAGIGYGIKKVRDKRKAAGV